MDTVIPNLDRAILGATSEDGLISYEVAKFIAVLYSLQKRFDADFNDDDRIFSCDFLEWVKGGGQYPD